ncbi:hypothetical protein [Methylosinus sp. PW1]|uniref:hypothetical protein n=1 Tax=Methylosinus sp. PW1 TaxID=107636 RepID=UPI000569C22C|nr:hypothetical protein [Methylosinus sp. PW1]
MSDRKVVYPGQQLPARAILDNAKFGLIGLGSLARALFGVRDDGMGSSTGVPLKESFKPVVAGLQCAPTTPASLSVVVSPGEIYVQEAVDSSDFGISGNTDAHTTIKQGILADAVTLPITPPATAGYAQYFLIQATYQNLDTDSFVVSYVNHANPQMPFSGPGGTGVAQPTTRKGLCVVNLKAGAAAASGSEVAPTPDVGYAGLWLIRVSHGQTEISSYSTGGGLADIKVYPNAPFIPSFGAPRIFSGTIPGSLTDGTPIGGLSPAFHDTGSNAPPHGSLVSLSIQIPTWAVGDTPRLQFVPGGAYIPIQRFDGFPISSGDVGGSALFIMDNGVAKLVNPAVPGRWESSGGAGSGSILLPNGYLLQWIKGPDMTHAGGAGPGVDPTQYIPWPTSFNEACYAAFPVTVNAAASTVADRAIQLVDYDQYGANIINQWMGGGATDTTTVAAFVFAIGK